MTDVHLLTDLTFELCPDRANCTILHHIPGATLAEANILTRDYIIGIFQLDTPPTVNEKFYKEWQDENGEPHRDYDLPARIYSDGSKHWYQHGKHHRDRHDQPAIIYAAGSREWWLNGAPGRHDDKPAVIDGDGNKTWYLNGVVGREGDKPTVVNANGDQIWHDLSGYRHRDNGPAVIHLDGTEEWWAHDVMTHYYDPELNDIVYLEPDPINFDMAEAQKYSPSDFGRSLDKRS